MAKHGTRTMYVHYGCRCDACCQAEHLQYLKRADSQKRQRVHSKWTTEGLETPSGRESQKAYNKKRYKAITNTHTYRKRIAWREIADKFGMKCAICGCEVKEDDFWINEYGRKCFGRNYPTVDHIVSLKKGGMDIMENVQLVCKHCNSSKGAK